MGVLQAQRCCCLLEAQWQVAAKAARHNVHAAQIDVGATGNTLIDLVGQVEGVSSVPWPCDVTWVDTRQP